MLRLFSAAGVVVVVGRSRRRQRQRRQQRRRRFGRRHHFRKIESDFFVPKKVFFLRLLFFNFPGKRHRFFKSKRNPWGRNTIGPEAEETQNNEEAFFLNLWCLGRNQVVRESRSPSQHYLQLSCSIGGKNWRQRDPRDKFFFDFYDWKWSRLETREFKKIDSYKYDRKWTRSLWSTPSVL